MGAGRAARQPRPARSMPQTRAQQGRGWATTGPVYTPPRVDAEWPSRDVHITCSPGGGARAARGWRRAAQLVCAPCLSALWVEGTERAPADPAQEGERLPLPPAVLL